MDTKHIEDCLRARGALLNPPANSELIRAADNKFPITFSSSLSDLYAQFDGFSIDTYDSASQLSIWTIEKILKSDFNAVSSVNKSDFFLVIGDFLIESDFISIQANKGVYAFFEKKKIAATVDDFFDLLCSGRFDFLTV